MQGKTAVSDSGVGGTQDAPSQMGGHMFWKHECWYRVATNTNN